MVPGHKLLNSVYKGVPRKVPLLFGVKEVYMKGGGADDGGIWGMLFETL